MSYRIPESELILNPDGSIYHLNILPEDLADDIITVGDPDRVDKVSERLDEIYLTKHKREFKTITGRAGSKNITIISTGIGTDNIDIVFTELDVLKNVDLETRTKKEQHTSLRFYRIGTSGALREDIDIDSTIISEHAIGLEGLMHFYNHKDTSVTSDITSQAERILRPSLPSVSPYAVSAAPSLINRYTSLGRCGITVTATGFYGPQGRGVLAQPRNRNFLDDITSISIGNLHVTNLEMETAGIYGMSSLLGHEAISFNAILANRRTQKFSSQPGKTVDRLIDRFFEIFTS